MRDGQDGRGAAGGSTAHVRKHWFSNPLFAPASDGRRGTTMHVGFLVRNESDQTIVIKDDGVRLEYEGVRGKRTRQGKLVLLAGEKSSFVRIFSFESEVAEEGTAHVLVTLDADGQAAFELPVKKYVMRASTAP